MNLTPYWFVPESGPIGIGVTAHDEVDALQLIRENGYADYLKRRALLTHISREKLPPAVQEQMGPIVVRGMWYPIVRPA